MKKFITTLTLVVMTLSGQAQLKESIGKADFSDWNSIVKVTDGAAEITSGKEVSYTYSEGKNIQKGFRKYFCGRDWSLYKALSFDVFLASEGETSIDLAFSVARENAQAFEPVSYATIVLSKQGWNRVYVPWNLFSLNEGQMGTLRGVQNFSLTPISKANKKVKLRNVELVKGEIISLEAPVQGLSSEAGGSVSYKLEVGNVSDSPQTIQLKLPTKGWEAMKTTITPSVVNLAAGEIKTVDVTVAIPSTLPQGTNEVQAINVIANGNGASAQTIEFTTAVKVASPFIIHNAEGWAEVKEKAESYDWAAKELARYDSEAQKWRVPAIATEVSNAHSQGDKGLHIFNDAETRKLLSCAIAYQLTSKEEYAQKCLDFLLCIADEQKGYASTFRICNAAFVQEGGVYQNIARAYDLIANSELVTDEHHRLIKNTLRMCVETVILDSGIGAISNWDLSELTGALYCALIIQDFHLAKEIFYAPDGLHQQFAQGVMSDGWWYECSVGYNIWCASMFSEAAVALKPWGINFLDEQITIGKTSYYSLMPSRRTADLCGINFNKWGRITKNTITIKDMWSAMIPFLDYRGVMFAVNDALESLVVGEPFELAYYLYRDPEFASVVKMGDKRSLLYGVPELPDFVSQKSSRSAYAENAGVVQLRSQTEGREQREQIQAVLHYGTHGGHHGHFDRTNLLSMMRYGRSFYNPEMIWYGYSSYNYKFLVQTSMTKNMVVVDQKMQEAVESKRTLFYEGDMVQATSVETEARWSHPPYGGGGPEGSLFQDQAWREGRTFDFPKVEPKYGELTDFTEPVLQRRLMVMMDDYIVLADYVDSQEEHTYDWLFQMKGFESLVASKKKYLRHDNQLSTDPLSAAQFFTDCEWFETDGTVRSSFKMLFGEGSDNEGTRAPNSEDGPIKIDVFNAWPRQNEVAIAAVPENHNLGKQVWYNVSADDKVIHSDSTGAWILGRKDISLNIKGCKQLTLKTQLKNKARNNTIFWGDAKVILKNGKSVDLSTLPIKYINTIPTDAKDKDYYGGPIKLGGELMSSALPGMPADFKDEAVAVVDLSGVEAVKFEAIIGGDFPLGDETQRRKTLNVRSVGKQARFLSVIEPYEAESVVKSVEAKSADELVVTLKDGRRQEIKISNFESDSDNIVVDVKEYKGNKLLREESAKNK